MEQNVTWERLFGSAKDREEKKGETEEEEFNRDSDTYIRLKQRGKWEKSLFLLLK